MRSSSLIKGILFLLLACAAQANPKPKSKPTPNPWIEAHKKEEEARTQLAQQFYTDLHASNTNLTVEQLKAMSSDDIRRLYCALYINQGQSMMDAKSKSSALKIWDK